MFLEKQHILKKKVMAALMHRQLGFILFWIAVGMLLMLLIESKIVGIIIVGLLLLIGYNCFCFKG